MSKNFCSICGHHNPDFLFRVESNHYAPGEYFNLYKCKKCGGACIIPHLEFASIQKYYPDSYNPHDTNLSKTTPTRGSIMKRLRKYVYGIEANLDIKQIKAIRKILSVIFDRLTYRSFPWPKNDGKLLDIGSGNGVYLTTVSELGWNGYGIEANSSAAQHTNEMLGLEIQTGDFKTVTYPDNFFDVITMWHSLEHFPEPKKIIRKVRNLLKDDGVLMIGLPNFASLDRKLFRESWNGLEIPLHLCHFTPESIQSLLIKSGFNVRKIVHTIRPSDMTKSMINFLEDRYCFKSNKYLRSLLFGISIPISLCFAICRRSSIIKISAS